jgi:4-carboxymuconolactone decarboxylase
MTDERYDKGLELRRQVLGERYVDQALQNVDDFNADFQRFLTEYCWGDTWGREGLSLKQRSLNTLCMLGVLNRPHEFEAHVRGALRNGCTLSEIRETLQQIAVYGGVPAGVDAFRRTRKVLAEEGVAP